MLSYLSGLLQKALQTQQVFRNEKLKIEIGFLMDQLNQIKEQFEAFIGDIEENGGMGTSIASFSDIQTEKSEGQTTATTSSSLNKIGDFMDLNSHGSNFYFMLTEMAEIIKEYLK